MNNNFFIHNLFPVPVYVSKLKISETIKKSLMRENYQPLASNDGFITNDKYILNNKIYADLKKDIDFHAKIYINESFAPQQQTEFYMTTSWGVKHDINNYCNSHNHANSIVSGILYIKCDENSGKLNFLNLQNNLGSTQYQIDATNWNQYNCKSWSIIPEIENIILFPSNMYHSVDVNISKEHRYCVAFNYFVKGKLGHGEGELIL